MWFIDMINLKHHGNCSNRSINRLPQRYLSIVTTYSALPLSLASFHIYQISKKLHFKLVVYELPGILIQYVVVSFIS